MPSTSPSWSTLVNRPLAARHATIAFAMIGPIPGNASSCSSVAVFRSTGPVGPAPLPSPDGPFSGGADVAPAELRITAGAPTGAVMPTRICSPSATLRAMFRPTRSAPASAPPAAVTASATRAPAGSVTNPGLCTRPATLTTTSSAFAGGAGAPGTLDETICTGGSFAAVTGGLSSASTAITVTRTATTPTTASAITPARPGSARTDASHPGLPDTASGSHRDSEVSSFGSGSPSGSVTSPGCAVRRRCARSAGV
ncbi:hypothetical protein MAUB1S_04103 [Mycolicibacterium aubagnense]